MFSVEWQMTEFNPVCPDLFVGQQEDLSWDELIDLLDVLADFPMLFVEVSIDPIDLAILGRDL